MNSISRARAMTFPALALVGALLFTFTGDRARADAWDKKTILTVDQPIQVRNTYLEPGTYVFKLLNSPSDRHIVQIYNSDQSRIIDTVLAIPNYRLQPTGDSRFTFWETPPGTAKALRAWFYPGDNFGQEFPYPKHLRQLEVASAAVPQRSPERPPVNNEPATEPKAEAPAPTAAPQPQAAAAVEPQASTQPEPPAKPVEVAQNTPSPAPVAASPEPAYQPSAAAELPKTAGHYPAMGMAGLGLLLSYGLLRKTTS